MFSFVIGGGGAFMIVYGMPFVTLSALSTIHLEISMLGVWAPMLVGGFVFGSYGLKKKKDYTAVYQKINQQLKENALSDVVCYEELDNLEKNLKNIMLDISEVKLELEKKKIQLEEMKQKEIDNLDQEFSKKNNSMKYSYSYHENVEKQFVEEFQIIDSKNIKKKLLEK